MPSYEEIKTAILDILVAAEARDDKPLSMFEIGIPLVGTRRFTQDEVVNSLFTMQAQGFIKLLDGNRICITDKGTKERS